ncbi:hypothetical protein HKD37_14G040904 [Glycine soja]
MIVTQVKRKTHILIPPCDSKADSNRNYPTQIAARNSSIDAERTNLEKQNRDANKNSFRQYLCLCAGIFKSFGMRNGYYKECWYGV